jgi:predicted Zn-dependent protease
MNSNLDSVGEKTKHNQPEFSEIDAVLEPLASSIESVDNAVEGSNPERKATSTKPEIDPDAQTEPKQSEPDVNPEQVVVRLQQKALQLQSEGKWQEAETVLQRALRIDVQKVDIYHQLATVRMGQQRFDEAEQIALKGLSYTDKTPKFKSSLWDVIAQCRSARGDLKGANEARSEMLKWMND